MVPPLCGRSGLQYRQLQGGAIGLDSHTHRGRSPARYNRDAQSHWRHTLRCSVSQSMARIKEKAATNGREEIHATLLRDVERELVGAVFRISINHLQVAPYRNASPMGRIDANLL